MKKHVLLSAFLLLFAFYSHAQSVQYGVVLGANLTNMKGNGIKSTFDPGYLAGGFSRITLNKKWNIQPEVLFNISNTKKADNFINFYNINGSPTAGSKINLDYISVPILFGYKINKLFTVNVGPQYSFLVYDNETLLETTKASAFKRNDLAIVGGASLRLENVSFFGRYIYGIANINGIDERYKWHNRQVELGFNIGLF